MERIIAKIDNDFNPDNSDWIPRVAAWAIDAMAILNVMRTQTNTKTYTVTDRIAYDKCGFGDNIIKVYDSNGCEVKEAGERCSACIPSTGEGEDTDTDDTTDVTEISNTMGIDDSQGKSIDTIITTQVGYDNAVHTHKVQTIKYGNSNFERNYVKVGNDKIELNFDTKCIKVVSKGIKTEVSDTFGCEVPVIPNNGLLIECIAAWCMYKMLCRGYTHPVFNLTSPSPAINPFIFWTTNKDNAKDSVTIDEQGDIDTKIWRSGFYIDTFDPRR